jgi:hypothetical protein
MRRCSTGIPRSQVPLRFFWDKKDADDVTVIDENLMLYRINDDLFLKSMAGCMAYATTSGFESICEALYTETDLMIPVHVEQEFNAYDAVSPSRYQHSKFKLNKLLNLYRIIVPMSVLESGAPGGRPFYPGDLS